MKALITALLCVLIVAAAAYTSAWLIRTRPLPERREPTDAGALVEAIEVRPGRTAVRVEAMGTVVPARRVALIPEVSGRIVELSPSLVPGGRIRRGEIVVRIDPRDFEHALARAEADLERARYELALEEGRQTVAKREWSLLEPDVVELEANRALALREPHLRNAKAAFSAAESGLADAKLRLERTRLAAPFDCLVEEESVEEGQLVSPQSALATLVGTERFWVQVSVSVDDLAWIRLPSSDGASPGAEARVVQELGRGERIVRLGRVARLLGSLDPVGRMARLLVEIDDPLGPAVEEGSSDLPLLLGAYVRVEIQGRVLEDAFELSRSALRDGGAVWVANGEDRLEIRPVEVAWRGRESVAILRGLSAGDRVVTSPIPNAIRGMKLRLASGAAPEGK